jgi:hypothetical protein
MGADAIASASSIREETVPKWLSGLPFPKVIKDTLKTVDDAMYGPRTATGVSTGVGPDWAEGLTNMFGFRTRRQTRPYEQGSAIKYTVEKRLEGEKNALIRRAATQGIGAVRDDVRAWNKAHPDQKITISSIVKSKKRLRQAEKDIRKANVEAL